MSIPCNYTLYYNIISVTVYTDFSNTLLDASE